MSIFSKLFKKKTNTNFNLINLNDIIIFPKKEFYKENKEKYKEYMNTYNLILSSKKYITSLDLEINNIDINFYTNIITKTTLELDNMLDLVNNNIERSEELATILISKLKYYHNELNTYKNILFIELKALKDILKSKPFLSKNKKDTIKNSINLIMNKLIIIETNINAINCEVSSYLSLISISNLPSKNEVIMTRFNKYTKYMSAFNLPYEEQICIDNIVYMEVLLEKHIHNLEINISNINSTDINLLNELILKLTCLIEFKHTDLDNAKLEKVVNLKWNKIKENYKNNIYNYTFVTDNKLEKDILKHLLEQEINNAFNPKTYLVEDEKYKKTFLTLLSKVLKYNGFYDIDKLLYDELKLSILFNRNNIHKIESTLKKFKEDLRTFKLFDGKTYSVSTPWDRELESLDISIYSLFTLIKYSKIDKTSYYNLRNRLDYSIVKMIFSSNKTPSNYEEYKSVYNKSIEDFPYKDLYNLFLYIDEKNNNQTFTPINEIKIFDTSWKLKTQLELIIINNICKDLRKKKAFIANKSLEKINIEYNLFTNELSNDTGELSFYLNSSDKLKTVYIELGNRMYNKKIDRIIISPNIQTLSILSPCSSIEFTDYRNSCILNDDKTLENFISTYLIQNYSFLIKKNLVETYIVLSSNDNKQYSVQINLNKLIKKYKRISSEKYTSKITCSKYITLELKKLMKKSMYKEGLTLSKPFHLS